MDSISPASAALAQHGPLAQLIDMGGPVMIVLIAIAVILGLSLLPFIRLG